MTLCGGSTLFGPETFVVPIGQSERASSPNTFTFFSFREGPASTTVTREQGQCGAIVYSRSKVELSSLHKKNKHKQERGKLSLCSHPKFDYKRSKPFILSPGSEKSSQLFISFLTLLPSVPADQKGFSLVLWIGRIACNFPSLARLCFIEWMHKGVVRFGVPLVLYPCVSFPLVPCLSTLSFVNEIKVISIERTCSLFFLVADR